MWQGGDEVQKICERQVVKNLGNCSGICVGGLTDILKASSHARQDSNPAFLE
jgi:hypothetical protein